MSPLAMKTLQYYYWSHERGPMGGMSPYYTAYTRKYFMMSYPKKDEPYANPKICVRMNRTTKMADSMKRIKPWLL